MRIIKPGKLGILPGGQKRVPTKAESAIKPREIWDDFSSSKKKKKKEFERGDKDRMVAKSAPSRSGLFKNEIDPESLPKPEYREDFETLEVTFGYQFKDRTWLERALTHRSALSMQERTDYERLEFLGDAVLDLSIAHLLSDKYPEAKEGDLSKMRAALVNTQALADVAKELGLSPFIRLGRSESASKGSERPSIMADVTEAVIGGIYRDSNYDTVFSVIEKLFTNLLNQVEPSDPKTELQEALHGAGSEPPSYLLELVEGPEHAPLFVTVVIVDGEIAGRGRGNTKKAAQQASASEALKRMFPIHTQAITSYPGLNPEGLISELLLIAPEKPNQQKKAA